MQTLSGQDFYDRNVEFVGHRITVRNARGQPVADGTFLGIKLAMTGPYEYDPRLTRAQIEAGLADVLYPDYPGASKHVPFFDFEGRTRLADEVKWDRTQSVDVY